MAVENSASSRGGVFASGAGGGRVQVSDEPFCEYGDQIKSWAT